MSRLRHVVISFVMTLLAAAAAGQAKTEFSATLTQEFQGKATQQKLFVSGGKMRIEPQPSTGDQAVLILDFTRGATYILMPNEKTYVGLTGMQADPARQMRFLNVVDQSNPCATALRESEVRPAKTVCKSAGTATLNGRSATKWVATLIENKRANIWVDSKLGYVVRVEAPSGKSELQDIREEAQDPKLFEVPDGYSRVQLGTVSSTK